MANTVRASGFSPCQNIVSGGFNDQSNTYVVLSTDTNAIYVGDLVKSFAGADVNGVPAVTKCNSGDTPRGVVVGVFVVPPTGNNDLRGVALSLENTFAPATKAKNYYVLVMDDPRASFWVQDDGLAALGATAFTKNINYTVAAPNAPLQGSATVLNTATVATTQSLPVKILGLKLSPDNAMGVNATYVVTFNQHELLGNTAGV